MKRQVAKLVSMSNTDRSRTERDTLADTKPDPTLPHIGTRLALTRRALTLTRFQMARLIGTDMPTWGTYEAGLQRIPVDRALKLSTYGIPLDWVYHGRMTDLHPHIRAKIRQLQAEERRGDRPGRVSPSRRL
jgi:transcriptional regulator with XRE-family HTH domain